MSDAKHKRLIDDCARALDPKTWRMFDRANSEGCQIGSMLQFDIDSSRDKAAVLIEVTKRVLVAEGWVLKP